ncbi:hypothetical protein BDZ91DRAFT_49683 [Kalaharituber pfeilii]|nr:hypothetical protein BDZ91DRAFT_49683 [Kalaharituber pfeilii]
MRSRAVRINSANVDREWFEYETTSDAHTTMHKEWMSNITSTEIATKSHDGRSIVCYVKGDIIFTHKNQRIELKDVLYHQEFSNLISGKLLLQY